MHVWHLMRLNLLGFMILVIKSLKGAARVQIVTPDLWGQVSSPASFRKHRLEESSSNNPSKQKACQQSVEPTIKRKGAKDAIKALTSKDFRLEFFVDESSTGMGTGTDISKNHKKTVKNKQTRTREMEEYKRAKDSKPKSKIVNFKKAQKRRGFMLEALTKQAQVVTSRNDSLCGGPFNSGNCRHCTNVSFRDEPVYDSNPNSYNQIPNFSNPLPHHNYETDSRSDTGAAFQAEFAKLQQNFKQFMAQQSCSYCGAPFNNGNYPSCSIVGARNEFVHDPNPFPYDNTSDFYDQPPQHHEKLHKALQAVCEKLNQQEQAANVSTHLSSLRDVSIFYDDDNDDDDDEESTIPLNEIISQLPPSIAITTILPTMEPKDSLIMGDENLSTILEKESDEFIKSSVEDLVPIPNESKDTSDNDSESDLPFCDISVTFSNPLFNSNDDFTSSDDESLLEEDVPKGNYRIYSNPLSEFYDEYISSDVNPLFNEVLKDIESEDSYVSKLDEPDLLVTPLFDANEDKCFDPGGDIDKIDTFLDNDVSTDVENDRDPRSLEDEPDKDDLKNIVKVFDPGIQKKIISPTYVRLSFEDHHYISLTYVIRIFLPYLTYSMDSSFLLSSGSEDTIFDPDISVFSFYSLELTDCPDYEDSHARGFVHRHSIFYPLHAYIWESDILYLIE
ncbi:hypothetical protein Tco_0398488 [Tanacetum coccineum]